MKSIEFTPPAEILQLPPISPSLLVPCYVDLMPAIPESTDIKVIIQVDIANYLKHNLCYLRQYELIKEVKLRESYIQ